MKIFEVTSNPESSVMAMTQLLKGRAKNMAVDDTISVDAFIRLAREFGMYLSRETFDEVIQEPPFNNIIAGVHGDTIKLVGNESDDVDEFGDDDEFGPTEDPTERALDRVETMAKRQIK